MPFYKMKLFLYIFLPKMNLESGNKNSGISSGGDDSQFILHGNFDLILDDLIINNNFNFQCHLCHQHFLIQSEFKVHLKKHGQQVNFTCPQCQLAGFNSSTTLWNHMHKAHFRTKEGFYCSLCNNKAFKHAFNFHLHMLIHLEEQPEKCKFCPKAFRTKPSLRKHELIHTGYKPFPCPKCNSRFKTKDELKQHSISHTTGKPYNCQFCMMDFKYQASLKRHKKKGRCKIGKHWCPKVKRNVNKYDKKYVDCDRNTANDSSNLFCDVFLGGSETSASTTNILLNNSNSTMLEPLFSF